MTTGLQIGRAVAALLAAHSGLRAAIGSKVFPIVSKEGTSYPFVVYRRNSIEVHYTKDGKAGETVNVDIVIAAGSYAESIGLADMVREAIEGKAFVMSESLKVRGSQLTAADEEFFEDSNVYTQTLNFNFYL